MSRRRCSPWLWLRLRLRPARRSVHKTKRESSANRKARIDRLTEDTYTRRWEVFGGGGYLRFRSGEFLQKNNEVTWNVNTTYFLTPRLGITGDVRGAFGNAKVGNNTYNVYNPLITEYTFMGGPTYRVYAKMKSAVSVNVLGGYSLGNFDGGSKDIPATLLGMWPHVESCGLLGERGV